MESGTMVNSFSEENKQLSASMESNSRNETGTIQLKRQLGIWYGIVIIVGLTVGGGIYITPQTVLRNAGSPALTLIIWLVGGINALLGALVFAEIGIHIPIAGEGYPYLCELYNPYVGFMYVWQILLLVRPGSNAIKFIIFGRYLLKPQFPQCDIPRMAVLLLATIMTILVTILNCMNLKFMARGQSFLSGISVSTLIAIAILGIYFVFTGRTDNLEDPFGDSKTDPGSLVMALYATMFSYNGWSALNFLIEELKKPSRNLPIAIVISNILLTTLYALVNLTYLVVLNKEETFSSEAVAISAVMKVSVLGGWIMSILIAITACSSCNSGQLVASRMAFAASRNGHFPSALSFISITQFTPVVSVIFIGVVIVLFIWAFEAEFILVNVTFSGIIGDLLISIGYLRRRLKTRIHDDLKFKVPILIHVFYGLSLFIFTMIPLLTNPIASAAGFLLIVFTSSLYYFVFVHWKNAFKWTGTDKVNLFIQKLFNCAPVQKNR